MKMCTHLVFNGEAPPRVADISFVDDSHEFGWRDGELHLEAEVQPSAAQAPDSDGKGVVDG